jgi:hypothetical protein
VKGWSFDRGALLPAEGPGLGGEAGKMFED